MSVHYNVIIIGNKHIASDKYINIRDHQTLVLVSPIFSSNSEAFASELRENIGGTCLFNKCIMFTQFSLMRISYPLIL